MKPAVWQAWVGGSLVAFSLWIVPASPTLAAAVCSNAQYVHKFDGDVTLLSNNVVYVSGSLVDRTIALCTTADGTSGSLAWLMLSGAAAYEYAQIGYGRIQGEVASTTTFTEYNDGSNTHPGWQRSWWPGIFVSGHTHSYVVSFSYTSGHVSMTVDGSTKATTPWGADTTWTGPWNGEFNGEVFDPGDDIAGTAATKAAFSLLKVKLCRTCSLVAPTWDPNYHPIKDLSWMQYQDVNPPNGFNIWTQR